MFIPVGVLSGLIWRRKGLAAGAGFSIAIELLQLVTARGLMEFDDVMHNMIGPTVGIAIVMFAGKRFKEWNP